MLNRRRRRFIPKRAANTGALRRYEDAKAQWIAANPQASAQEYQRAMTQLAAKRAA